MTIDTAAVIVFVASIVVVLLAPLAGVPGNVAIALARTERAFVVDIALDTPSTPDTVAVLSEYNGDVLSRLVEDEIAGAIYVQDDGSDCELCSEKSDAYAETVAVNMSDPAVPAGITTGT